MTVAFFQHKIVYDEDKTVNVFIIMEFSDNICAYSSTAIKWKI